MKLLKIAVLLIAGAFAITACVDPGAARVSDIEGGD